MSVLATAHMAGVLLLRSTRPVPLDSATREKCMEVLSHLEKEAKGFVTIYHRWLLMETRTVEEEKLWEEVSNQWMRSERTTFVELVAFLTGYINVWETSEFEKTSVHILVAEMDRVKDGLPPGFQKLFVELTDLLPSMQEGDTLDLKGVETALKAHTSTFPNVTEEMIRRCV